MTNEELYLELEEYLDSSNVEQKSGTLVDDVFRGFRFWKFIKKNLSSYVSESRREFLQKFINDKNAYISLVAMIESMPVSIWRRILWRYNINYESYFSFLRRISQERMRAIKGNYIDLFVDKKQPRVLTFFEKRKKEFSVEALFNESENQLLRSRRKGSWSYDFLGLDFGFNAYERDLNNDELTEAKSWREFLSIDNHSDDYVVNQEFGKYWWLYKTARSNYGWMRNKTVKLGRHICPGFWWTFFVHFLFWFLSPVSTVVLFFNAEHFASSHNLFWLILAVVIACPTPLWLLSASIWSSFRWLLSEERREKISAGCEKLADNKFIQLWGTVVLVIACGVVLAYVALLLYEAWYFLYPGFGVIGTFCVMVLSILYFGSHIVSMDNGRGLVKFSKRHIVFQIIYIATAIHVLFDFLVYYDSLVLETLKFVFSVFVSIGLGGAVITSLILLPIFVMNLGIFIENRKDLKRITDFFVVLMAIMLIPGVFYIITVGVKMIDAIKMLQFSGAEFCLATSLFALFWGTYTYAVFVLFLDLFQRDPEIVYCTNSISRKNQENHRYWKPLNKIYLKWYLRKNKTFWDLDEEAKIDLIERAHLLAYYIDCGDNIKRFLRLLLPVASEELIAKIELCNFSDMNNWYDKRFRIFYHLVHGKSFEDAKKLFSEERLEEEERERRTRMLVQKIFRPFIWIYETVMQVKWLSDKFHEMCPFVMEEGSVKMEE